MARKRNGGYKVNISVQTPLVHLVANFMHPKTVRSALWHCPDTTVVLRLLVNVVRVTNLEVVKIELHHLPLRWRVIFRPRVYVITFRLRVYVIILRARSYTLVSSHRSLPWPPLERVHSDCMKLKTHHWWWWCTVRLLVSAPCIKQLYSQQKGWSSPCIDHFGS